MMMPIVNVNDETVYLSLGAFEVCISNNPHKPAGKMYAEGESVRKDDYPTFYGVGYEAIDAYKDAYCNLIMDRKMTRAQRQHLELIRVTVFREADVIDKEVSMDDLLGGPFTCAITARF